MVKKPNFKVKLTAFIVTAIFMLSLTNVFAAPLTKDPPKGYATALPGKNDPGVLVYEDFETSVMDEDGFVGKFQGTQPDDPDIPAATIEVVTGVSKSGSKSLKVSKRGVSALGDPMGYNTVSYKDIGIDITEAFVKDPANRDKTDTYFVSAWVKNVDPSVTQYFWLQLQYGTSAEVWLPGQTYFEVKGSDWTQIGIAVVDGKIYYTPFGEDSTKSGIYATRSGLTTWSALKFITKNPKKDPKDKDERTIQTNYDFYVDDIIIWKVEDASKLVAELPTDDDPTPTTAPTKAPDSSGDKSSSTAPTDDPKSDGDVSGSDDVSADVSSDDVSGGDISSGTDSDVNGEDPDDKDSAVTSEPDDKSSTVDSGGEDKPDDEGKKSSANLPLIIGGIVLGAAAIVLAAVFVLKKKKEINE